MQKDMKYQEKAYYNESQKLDQKMKANKTV